MKIIILLDHKAKKKNNLKYMVLLPIKFNYKRYKLYNNKQNIQVLIIN